MKVNPNTYFSRKRIESSIISLRCASVSRRVFVQKFSYENNFDSHENEQVAATLFQMNGIVRRLV